MSKREEFYNMLKKEEHLKKMQESIQEMQKQVLITKTETELLLREIELRKHETELKNKESEFESYVNIQNQEFKIKEVELQNSHLEKLLVSPQKSMSNFKA